MTTNNFTEFLDQDHCCFSLLFMWVKPDFDCKATLHKDGFRLTNVSCDLFHSFFLFTSIFILTLISKPQWFMTSGIMTVAELRPVLSVYSSTCTLMVKSLQGYIHHCIYYVYLERKQESRITCVCSAEKS